MTDRDDMRAALGVLIAETLGDSTLGDLTDGQSLAGDLGLDSLDLSDLSIDIERRFGVDLDVGDMEGAGTVGGLLDLIEAGAAKAAEGGSL